MSAASNLNLYLVTFNCAREFVKPEAFASHFFDGLSNTAARNQPPDLIVLHLQEVAPLANGFNDYNLSKYYDRFKAAVRLAVKQRFPESASEDSGDAYAELTTGNAGLTAIMLFVRSQLQHQIVDVSSAEVGVGVQKMGNKGAIGLRIAWRTTESLTAGTRGGNDVMNLTFVAAHLAPMEEALERRNQDFVDIVSGLVFGSRDSTASSPQLGATRQEGSGENEPLLSTNSNYEDSSQTTSSRSKTSKLIGIYEPDTHLFFAGDLNYRTSITRPVSDGSDKKDFPQPTSSPTDPNHFSNLLKRDQLTAQLRAGKTLHGMTEAEINFPPTYKYSSDNCVDKDIMLDSEVSEWKWSSHRWPSWCDRILYSAGQPSSSTPITIHKYTALPLLATSDHRPVALSVSVPIRPVVNHEFAAHRPAELDPNWKANRQAAKFKEAVVGTVWHSLSTSEGLLNLTMGIAAVVCFAVLATVYSKEW